MLDLLRNLNNSLSDVFDKIAVDSRMVECLNRSPREMSVQSQRRVVSSESRQDKESSQETQNELELPLVKQRSRSHLATLDEQAPSGRRSRTTTIGGDVPAPSITPNRPSLMTYGSLISINRPHKGANIRTKPSFR